MTWHRGGRGYEGSKANFIGRVTYLNSGSPLDQMKLIPSRPDQNLGVESGPDTKILLLTLTKITDKMSIAVSGPESGYHLSKGPARSPGPISLEIGI